MFPVVKKKDDQPGSVKRRLGRFPVSSTSIIVKANGTSGAPAVEKYLAQDSEDAAAISYSPLSGTINASFLCELEKVESALEMDNKQKPVANLGKKCETKTVEVLERKNNQIQQNNSAKAHKTGASTLLKAKRSYKASSSEQLPHNHNIPSSQTLNPCDSPTNSPRDKKPKCNSLRDCNFHKDKSTFGESISSHSKSLSKLTDVSSKQNSKASVSGSKPSALDNNLAKNDNCAKDFLKTKEAELVPSKAPQKPDYSGGFVIKNSELYGNNSNKVADQKIHIEKENCSQANKSTSEHCIVNARELECDSRSRKKATEYTLDRSHVLSSSYSGLNLSEDKRLLSSWGLPVPVLEVYKKQGISTMFEWQAECLLTGNALGGDNLVYSAPTSAGKTLVAELLVLKKVVETKKKAVVILPFVAVAREKMYQLQSLYQDIGVRVGGYMGSSSPSGGLSHVDIAVCTIEKANGLLNRLMEEGRINEIGIVVVDELHMVGDSHRGYLLELMLTKLIYLTRKNNNDEKVQIIGMSATLPNLQLLANWLRASLYCTDYRPVPLTEYVKVDNKILNSDLVVQREIPASLTFPTDQDHVVALCLETVTAGHAVLIFCPTKAWCENLCEIIARHFFQILQYQSKKEANALQKESCGEFRLCIDKTRLHETIEQLKRCPAGVDPMLAKCIINGVAYHHAGLTFDEREIIEGAFKECCLKVLVATSTLSSGVNLPAQRVIVRTPMFHGQVIDSLTYKQMSGRAGRRGVDKFGESILMCKLQEKTKGQCLLKSALPNVESCLQFTTGEGLNNCLKRAILEVVVSGAACSYEDVISYIGCSLLSVSLRGNDMDKMAVVSSCIQYLQDNEFITVHVPPADRNVEESSKKKFFATQLGAAIFASSLSPDEGLQAFAELQKARKSFVLETDLHLIYLVTPVYTTDLSSSLDWYSYHSLWEALSPADRRVAQLVGVSEAFIGRAIKGSIPTKTLVQKKALAVHQRFYTTLILNCLIQETPVTEVAAKFNCNKGQLQSLQQSVSTYAGMMTVLCGKLGWHNLELLLSQFQARLSSGVQQELVDLVRIQSLNACSARMLYNAGYQSVADVARAEVVDVANLFKKASPFQSEKKLDGETEWEQQERKRAKCIWLTGRKGVTETEAAAAIIQEAKVIIQDHLGVSEIHWGSKDDESTECSDDEGPAAISDNDCGVMRAYVDSQCDMVIAEARDSMRATNGTNESQHIDMNEDESANGASRSFGNLATSQGRGYARRSPGNISMNKSRRSPGHICMNKSRRSPGNISMNNPRRSPGNITTSGSRRCSIAEQRKSFYGQVVVSPPVSLQMDKTSITGTSSVDKTLVISSSHRALEVIEPVGHNSDSYSLHSNTRVFSKNYSLLTLKDHEYELQSEKPAKSTDSHPKGINLDAKLGDHEDNFEESIILDTQTENLLYCPVSGFVHKSLVSNREEELNKNLGKSSADTADLHEDKNIDNDCDLFSESFIFPSSLLSTNVQGRISNGEDQEKSKHHAENNNYHFDNNIRNSSRATSSLSNNSPSLNLAVNKKHLTPSHLNSLACEAGSDNSDDSLIAASNFDKYGDMDDDSVLVEDRSDGSQVDNSDTSELNNACVIQRQVIASSSKSLNSLFHSPLDENFFLTNFTQDHGSSPLPDNQNTGAQANSESLLQPQYSTPKILQNSMRSQRKSKDNLRSQTKNLLSAKFKTLETVVDLNVNCADDFFMDSLTSSVLDKVQEDCDHMIEAENSPRMPLLRDVSQEMNVTGSDGSDCVPPTPPEDESKIASPLRCTLFLSPLRPRPQQSPISLSKLVSSPSVSGVDQGVQREGFTKLKQKTKIPADKQLAEGEYQSHSLVSIGETGTRLTEANLLAMSQNLTQQSFSIIDVCAHKELFETFLAEWKSKDNYTLSIACEKSLPELRPNPGPTIGGKFVKKSKRVSELDVESSSGLPIPESSSQLVGLAVSWENRDSYYISLLPKVCKGTMDDANDTLAEPEIDHHLTQSYRIESVRKVLHCNSEKTRAKVSIYDAKTVYKHLATTLGVSLLNCEDPRIADWLREPTARLKNLHRMVASHCPEELALLECIGGMQGYQSLGTDTNSQVSPRVRACTESVLTARLMAKLVASLAEDHLLSAFTEIEMPSLVTLARMELNGFGVSCSEIEKQKTLMLSKLTALEEKACSLAGHVFSLTSTDDVAKVLYVKLRLPVNGDPGAKMPTRIAAGAAKGRRSLLPSTSKETLEKLEKFHPLPAIILEWRRLNSALTKSLFALQKAVRPCVKLKMSRVYGDCQVFTATGRVSMAEPNLQNIPKDFSCKLSDLIGDGSIDSVSTTVAARTNKAMKIPSACRQGNKEADEKSLRAPISLRTMFIPFTGGVLLAADYSQLELRIFAHLCGDSKLVSILNTEGGDVFNMIAAEMKSVDLDRVTAELRQQAKQVCYGMLYGIGQKALGEQMDMDENDAFVFMETFKNKYQGIKKYLKETIDFCQKNGYVKTIFNRRRYLPSIKSQNIHIRAQAERQAVNTTIQGSAADLVKIAMTNIDKRLLQVFPSTKACHTQIQFGLKTRSQDVVEGAYLVLQLHDELIYEVSCHLVPQVARLIKTEMERAIKLNVCLPVKIKVGPSWGQLKDYPID